MTEEWVMSGAFKEYFSDPLVRKEIKRIEELIEEQDRLIRIKEESEREWKTKW